MKIDVKVTAAVGLAVLGLLALLWPSQEVAAQAGSRLCGKYAVVGDRSVGFLLEARKVRDNFREQCNNAICRATEQINSDPALKGLSFTTANGTACENIGKYFIDGGQYNNVDMCDYMKANKDYQVNRTSTNGALVTTYAQKSITGAKNCRNVG